MAVTHHGDAGYYRYRGMPRPEKPTVDAEKIRTLLKANRQRLAFNASSSRPVSARLNQHVAQALRDGLKVTRLADAAGLSRWNIRTIGLTYDDLLPSGQPAEQQLAVITSLKSELAELEESRAALEARRLILLASARRLGVMDEFELAALSGLQSDAIRKMTWGNKSKFSRLAPERQVTDTNKGAKHEWSSSCRC
ncbi:hypothetical protein [Arthrobacter sp. OV608]|uniref:hypothetical protein n=1 Tax=Arthrobacter sp. OV608 TaxID=1882768 RepID=UPI0008C2C63D|nr:hypothetical protein [Arthrobacter sp. OV608]SEQ92693.1 hypothetical protein SAMN05444745_113119 [Arthrobacter sp. OV608]